MTIFDKIALMDRYGFRLSSRETFDQFAEQARREIITVLSGRFSVWEPGDIDAVAVVGDDPEELVEIAFDLASTFYAMDGAA